MKTKTVASCVVELDYNWTTIKLVGYDLADIKKQLVALGCPEEQVKGLLARVLVINDNTFKIIS